MNYRMTTRRLLASTLGLALLPALSLTAAVAAPSVAQAAEVDAECQVHSVLAMKTGDGTIPEDLKFLADLLKADQFAAYKSFRLLESKQLAFKLNNPASTTMTTGHKLTLEYLGSEAENTKLKLRAKLSARSGEGSLVDTRLHLPNNGIVLFGGVRHDDGRVVFAIHCKQVAADKK